MSAETRTYSTRLPLPGPADAALRGYAGVFSKAVRTTYAATERAVRAGNTLTKAERKAVVKADFGLTSRQANSVLSTADGKRAGIVELYKTQLADLKSRLKRKTGQVKRDDKRLADHKDGKVLHMSPGLVDKVRRNVFQARTKAEALTARLAELTEHMNIGSTSLTFGTKKRLRERADLEKSDIPAWRAEWDLSRNGQFLVVGSKDETAGCQGCVATPQLDGTFSLRIRMPDSLGGGYTLINGVRFYYGADRLRHALRQQGVRAEAKRAQVAENKKRVDAGGEPAPDSQADLEGGAAITWRFALQGDGRWAISFTTDAEAAAIVTSAKKGTVGVDINVGFITVAEIDPSGNILYAHKIAVPDVGLSSGARDAARGEAVKQVMAICERTGKSLGLEDLDFTVKKRTLENLAPGSARKLSSLAYSALFDLFSARALDNGVEVVVVNPAYTSVQGQVCYANLRGWSTHQAAAGVIGRRGQGRTEKAPASGTQFVLVCGMAVEWTVPEETVRSDASRRWSVVARSLQQAIASHYRDRRRAGQPRTRKGSARVSVVGGGIPPLKGALRAPVRD